MKLVLYLRFVFLELSCCYFGRLISEVVAREILFISPFFFLAFFKLHCLLYKYSMLHNRKQSNKIPNPSFENESSPNKSQRNSPKNNFLFPVKTGEIS